MREEEKEEANKVLIAATKKLLRQQLYEAKFVSISHYYGEVKKQKISKEDIRKQKIKLDRQQYIDVSNLSYYYYMLVLNSIICS